jgi:hypothetical protein
MGRSTASPTPRVYALVTQGNAAGYVGILQIQEPILDEDVMPEAWSSKDERKYEHIKESARERGASVDRAEEIAARTVNRDRRVEGRTKSGRKTTSGTGNPNRSLEDRSVVELRNLAADRKVRGRSKMTKRELVSALRRAS